MGDAIFFKRCTFLLAIHVLFSSFLLNRVLASVYIVGDQEEWNSQTDFASWAERYNLSLGDVLVFKYVKGQHNVYEVTKDTFRSCDASSGVLAKYESGEDRVELNEVKRYWFICNIAGHCLGGMRFGIEVKEKSSKVTPSTNSTNNGALTPQVGPTPSNRCISERWKVISNFVPFGLLCFNLYFL